MFSRTTLEQRQQQDEREVNGLAPVLTQSAAGEVHFQHADEHRRIYCALAGKRGGDLFIKNMFRQMHDLFLQELQDSSPETQNDSFGIKAAAHFYVSTLIVMLTFWLDNNLQLSPEEANELFRKLTMHGLEEFNSINKNHTSKF